MALVGLGVALGLIAAWAASGWLASVAFEVSPADPLTLAAVVVLLTGVSLAAHIVPVRRATAVDPAVTLQAE
jgi:ABC-type antimicrobial peptide transport system permease subunit